ncbi:MAG: tubulin-like doman-containing protein [Turneriella sp.]|nr:tubulin-like doman-containing protein [Turneriella sp.]
MATDITNFIPTLIIGLGGTGSKVISHLVARTREQHFVQELRKNGLFQYLALDTDSGEQSALDIEDQYKILLSQNVNIREYARIRKTDDLEQGTNKFSWMPPESEVGPGFFNFNIEGGAGQLRLYSRLAFEVNWKSVKLSIDRALNNLNIINRGSLATKNKKINAFIICSIAGGTGSGCFLQTAAALKMECIRRGLDIYVNGVFFTPDIYTKAGHVPLAQHNNLNANAFACIKEIEAFNRLNLAGGHQSIPAFSEEDMVFHFAPSEDRITHKDFGGRPIDNVYLIEASNKNGDTLDLTKGFEAYEIMTADALYCLIFSPIRTKATSVLNNTSTANLEAGRSYYLCYGSFGSGRIIFPVKDIARYCAYRFTEEILCRAWNEIEKPYDQEMQLYERERLHNANAKEPMRHEVFIRTVKAQEFDERGIVQLKQALRHYRVVSGIDAKSGPAIPFHQAVMQEITSRIKNFIQSDAEDRTIESGGNLLEELSWVLPRESVTSAGESKEYKNAIELSAAIGDFQSELEEYLSYWENLQKTPFDLLQELHNLERSLSQFEAYIKERKQFWVARFVAMVMGDPDQKTSSLESIPKYDLRHYITFHESVPDRTLFFVRFFLSMELTEFEYILRCLTLQAKEVAQRRQEFDLGPLRRSIEADRGGRHYLLGLLRANFCARNAESIRATVRDYVENHLYHHILDILIATVRGIISVISYEKFKGENVGGSSVGLLQIFHEVTDYIRGDMAKKFEKDAEVARLTSRDAPAKGYTIKGVHHSPESKDHIWTRYMKPRGEQNLSKFIEAQQVVMDKMTTMWRALVELEKQVDKKELNERHNARFAELKRELIDATNEPAQKFFEQQLLERYDVIKAMKEEIIEVARKNSQIDPNSPAAQKEVEERVINEISTFFQGITPFANISGGDELQQVNIAAFSSELDSRHGLRNLLYPVARENTIASIRLDEEDAASLENPNEILFLRMSVSSRIDRFPNIENYRAAYERALICRHLDYSWTYRLPEFIMADEENFYNLFAFAETIGFIRPAAHAPRPENKNSEPVDPRKSGEYHYNSKFFNDEEAFAELRIGDELITYKETIWAFRKLLYERRQYESKNFYQQLQERWLDERQRYIAGNKDVIQKARKLYHDYSERMALFERNSTAYVILQRLQYAMQEKYFKDFNKLRIQHES